MEQVYSIEQPFLILCCLPKLANCYSGVHRLLLGVLCLSRLTGLGRLLPVIIGDNLNCRKWGRIYLSMQARKK